MKFGSAVSLIILGIGLSNPSFAQEDVEGIQHRVAEWMAAFNGKDNEAMQTQAVYPHVFCNPDGRLDISLTADEFVTDFELLARVKNWARSDIDSFQIAQRSSTKAHVAIQFSSYTSEGKRYQTSEGLWMLVKRQGDWYVQLQSWLGPTESIKEDRNAVTKNFLEEFLDAFNERNEERLQRMTLYPHVFVLHDGQTIIAQDSSEMTIDFEKLSAEDGWDHSTFDSYKLVQSSANKIHVAVKFSRFNKQGERYQSANVLYVLVQREGRWGLQMRSILEEVAVTLEEDSK